MPFANASLGEGGAAVASQRNDDVGNRRDARGRQRRACLRNIVEEGKGMIVVGKKL